MTISREEAERLANVVAVSEFPSDSSAGSAACFLNALDGVSRFAASVNLYDRRLREGGLAGDAELHPPLLIYGEPGTGKSLFVQHLRNAIEDEARRSNFYEHDCSVLEAGGLQADLERHLSEAAVSNDAEQKGVVFLDEVGDLDRKVQAQVSAAIARGIRPAGSSKPLDLVFVATTNQSIEKRAAEGRFNRNLPKQFSLFTVQVPPLREMREDIPLLIQFFLHKYAYKVYGQHLDVQTNVSIDALLTLLNYDWPGNGFELALEIRRLVFQLVLGSTGTTIVDLQMLSSDIRTKQPMGGGAISPSSTRDTTRKRQGPFKFDMATRRIIDADGNMTPPLPARLAGVIHAFFEKDEVVHRARKSFLGYEAVAGEYLKGQAIENSRYLLPREVEKRIEERTAKKIAQGFARDFRRYLKKRGIYADLIKCDGKADGYRVGKDWDTQDPTLHRAEVYLVSRDGLDALPG